MRERRCGGRGGGGRSDGRSGAANPLSDTSAARGGRGVLLRAVSVPVAVLFAMATHSILFGDRPVGVSQGGRGGRSGSGRAGGRLLFLAPRVVAAASAIASLASVVVAGAIRALLASAISLAGFTNVSVIGIGIGVPQDGTDGSQGEQGVAVALEVAYLVLE